MLPRSRSASARSARAWSHRPEQVLHRIACAVMAGLHRFRQMMRGQRGRALRAGAAWPFSLGMGCSRRGRSGPRRRHRPRNHGNLRIGRAPIGPLEPDRQGQQPEAAGTSSTVAGIAESWKSIGRHPSPASANALAMTSRAARDAGRCHRRAAAPRSGRDGEAATSSSTASPTTTAAMPAPICDTGESVTRPAPEDRGQIKVEDQDAGDEDGEKRQALAQPRRHDGEPGRMGLPWRRDCACAAFKRHTDRLEHDPQQLHPVG